MFVSVIEIPVVTYSQQIQEEEKKKGVLECRLVKEGETSF